MAAPNIVNTDEIYGFGISGAVTTSDTDVLTVAAEYVYKINTIMISNIDGTNTATISLKISMDAATTFYALGPAIPIPPKTVLTIIDKNNSIYLEEGDRIRMSANANSDLVYHISGEKITD